jgi:hypothetical protein
MFYMSRWSRLVAISISCLAFWLVACSQGPDVTSIGRVSTALVTTSPSGTEYGLRSVTITIAGPTPTTLMSNDTDPNETSLTAELAVGSYSATLEPGWVLERLDPNGPVAVDATLLSPNPVAFSISANTTANVTFLFQTDGGVIIFDPGTLVVDFEVQETTPTLPLLAEIDVAFVGNVVDVAATPGRGFVLSSDNLASFAGDGSLVFQTALPFGNARRVVAAGNDSIVVGIINNSLAVVRYDLNGLLLESFQVPANASILAGSEVCVDHDGVGRLAVVTHENGSEMRVRVLNGPNILNTMAIMGNLASPGRCEVFFRPDGRVVFGARGNGAQMFLAEMAPGGAPLFVVNLPGTGTGRFQLADDGTSDGLFAAFENGGGLELRRLVSGGGILWSTGFTGINPSSANQLLSGSFLGAPGISAFLAGGLGGTDYLTAVADDGTPIAEVTTGGPQLVGADAAGGLLWVASSNLVRIYPH